MLINRKVIAIVSIVIVGVGGFVGYFMPTQKPIDAMTEVGKPVVGSNDALVQPTHPIASKSADIENVNVSDEGELESITIKPDELSIEAKLDRLIQLDNSINEKGEHFEKLVSEYDRDISDTNKQKALSSALLTSSEYRSDILQKFEIERKQ